MRILSESEQKVVAGGRARRLLSASPLLDGGSGPPTPGGGLPTDDSWVVTPVHDQLGQVIGQNINMGDAGDLAITTQSKTYSIANGAITYTLSHVNGTSDNSFKTTTDLDGSDVTVSAGFDTQNGLFGGASITHNGATFSLGFNSSGDPVGGLSFNVGGVTGAFNYNATSHTLGISASGVDFGSVQCDFDIFGLGSGGGGGGVFCTGKPTVEQEVAGPHVLGNAQLSNYNTANHVEAS